MGSYDVKFFMPYLKLLHCIFYSCIIIVLAVFYIYIFTEIYVTQQNYLSESQSEQKLKIHTFLDT